MKIKIKNTPGVELSFHFVNHSPNYEVGRARDFILL